MERREVASHSESIPPSLRPLERPQQVGFAPSSDFRATFEGEEKREQEGIAPELKRDAAVPLNKRIGLLDSIEDHAEADRRTLADLPLEKTVQMSGTASSLIR